MLWACIVLCVAVASSEEASPQLDTSWIPNSNIDQQSIGQQIDGLIGRLQEAQSRRRLQFNRNGGYTVFARRRTCSMD
jgi:hypothetical protein